MCPRSRQNLILCRVWVASSHPLSSAKSEFLRLLWWVYLIGNAWVLCHTSFSLYWIIPLNLSPVRWWLHWCAYSLKHSSTFILTVIVRNAHIHCPSVLVHLHGVWCCWWRSCRDNLVLMYNLWFLFAQNADWLGARGFLFERIQVLLA